MKENTDKNFLLRKYVPSDIGGILHVFESSVTELCANDYSPAQIRAWINCADERKWSAEFLSRHTTVAVCGDEIIGFCDTEENGHIDRLYVSPEHAGKGVGASLIKDAESFLCGKEIRVEASVTAKPFFQKLGYRVIEAQRVQRHGETLINYKMIKTA